MARHSLEQALILNSRQIGEDNRIIIMLSPERGIFEAVLYGGRKSRLRSMVSPWHSGNIWLYNDTTRHSIKISDFEPVSFRPSLRENIYKNMAASLATELVIKTNAAGENQKTWYLLCGFLDGLELSTENECKKGLLRFLWRYLGILGERPDSVNCVRCEEVISSDYANYLDSEHGFSCSDCSHPEESYIQLSKEALNYLSVSAIETGSQARAMPLSKQSEEQIRKLLFHLLNFSTGIKLNTLEASIGIL